MSEYYDVVILGSGVGGLLCATMLAKEGFHVCVVEKNKQLGGCLQTFSHHRQTFDSCVHYVGGLGEGHTLRKILQYCGATEALNLQPLDPNGFDKIYFKDEGIAYPLAVGEQNFIDQLSIYFPEERDAIKEYMHRLNWVTDHFPLYHLDYGSATLKDAVTPLALSSVLGNITQNKKLLSVLTGNAMLYAGHEEKTPFYLHALVSKSYIHSAHKIRPGSSEISKALHKTLLSLGATVYKDEEVLKLEARTSRISACTTSKGRKIFAKTFISNIAPATTLSLIDHTAFNPAFRRRINTLPQTPSCFMVHAVLQPGTLKYEPHNIYWHAEEETLLSDANAEVSMLKSLALFTAEDHRHPGYAGTLSIMCYANFNDFIAWEESVHTTSIEEARPAAYLEIKEKCTEAIINQLYKNFPEYKGKIISCTASTPLTFRDYTSTPEGSLYGVQKDVTRLAQTTIATRTKIPNLLFTGQNVNMHGVLGVAITAVATTSEILGMDYLLKKIRREDKFA